MKSTSIPKYPGLLKRMFEALGTQRTQEIADMLGISASLVSDWKANRSLPSVAQLFQISSLGRTTIDWLLSGEGPQIVSVAFDNKAQGDIGYMERKYLFEELERSGGDFTQVLNSIIRDGLSVRGRYLPEDNDEAELVLRPLLKISKATPSKQRSYTTKLILQLMSSLSHLPQRGSASVRDPTDGMLVMSQYLKTKSLPLVGEIAAGEPMEIVPIEGETIDVPDFVVKPNAKYGVLRVKGDSMIESGIEDQSFIVCEARTDPQNGEAVVALINRSKATVKRFARREGGIYLEPANPKHKAIKIGPTDVLEIQGIVVWIFQRPAKRPGARPVRRGQLKKP